MELLGYILKMASFIPRISKIDESTLDFLSLFVFNKYLSSYDIYKIYSKEEDTKVTYKNIHKKIQRLLVHELIEKTNNYPIYKKSHRGAIYYTLSEEGVFALFCKNHLTNPNYFYLRKDSLDRQIEFLDDEYVSYSKEIIKNYRHYNIFKFFLFSWISIETIGKLHSDLYLIIFNHISYCCKKIYDDIMLLHEGIYYPYETDKSVNPGEVTIQLDWLVKPSYFHLNDLLEGTLNSHEQPFLRLISKIFPLPLITKVKKVEEFHYLLSSTKDELFVELIYDPKMKRLVISQAMDVNNSQFEQVTLPAESSKITGPVEWVEIIAEKLLSSYIEPISTMMITEIDEENLGMLREDEKFMKAFSDFDKKFWQNYNFLTGS